MKGTLLFLWIVLSILFCALFLCDEAISHELVKAPQEGLCDLIDCSDTIRKLFPKQTETNQFQIVSIMMEPVDFPKSAILQTESEAAGSKEYPSGSKEYPSGSKEYPSGSKEYKLWFILPFSILPPTQIIYKATTPFSWIVNSDFTILLIGHVDKVLVFEQTAMQKGTLGSWHMRQTFSFAHAEKVIQISIDNQGTALLQHRTGIFNLRVMQRNPCEYSLHRMLANQMKSNMSMSPESFVSGWVILSAPLFNQTDGLVSIYQVKIESNTLQFHQQISAPEPASLFGAKVIIRHCRLFISAPFASNGSGKVYIYQRNDLNQTFTLWQTLNPPPISSRLLHFGQTIAISENGQYLAVGAYYAGKGQLFIFSILDNSYQMLYSLMHQSSELTENFGKSISVDNLGNILVADKHNVYFYTLDQAKDIKGVLPPRVTVKSRTKTMKSLAQFSPSRLRISRIRKQKRKPEPAPITNPETHQPPKDSVNWAFWKQKFSDINVSVKVGVKVKSILKIAEQF